MSRLIPRERWGETTVAMMSETGQPITECPVCRYNLTGLPKNHRCPECGLEYDESMRIWRPPRASMRARVSRILNSALAWSIVILAAIGWKSRDFPSTGVILLFGAVSLLVVAGFHAERTRCFVVVGRGGLIYKRPFRRTASTLWSHVEFDPKTQVLWRRRGRSRTVLRLPVLAPDARIHEALAQAIRAYRGGTSQG